MPYYHMMGWFPFIGGWMILTWLVFVVLAYLVYKDAEKRGMNGLLWGLPVLVPWVGIIFLALYLFLRESGYHAHAAVGTTGSVPAADRRTPAEILDERYAKGEITRDQYLQMKEDIKSSTSPATTP